MVARGLVNQELAAARVMIDRASAQMDYRHCAAQLLFAYRCFLLELAEIHRLPIDREYPDAHDLLVELARQSGGGTTIAELEAFAECDWGFKLHAAQQAYLSLEDRVLESRNHLNQNLINAAQVADSEGGLCQEYLAASLTSLTAFVHQLRELSQEY